MNQFKDNQFLSSFIMFSIPFALVFDSVILVYCLDMPLPKLFIQVAKINERVWCLVPGYFPHVSVF